jgi:EAL domain-containing protein (putative c-di-GMP-specific phosphodiesterase class I)/putative methionine-R-sulfoxide reductase with GAF domain
MHFLEGCLAMKSPTKFSRVVDLQSARRRVPLDENALLSRIVSVQGEIAQAGLDPHKVVDVVTRRAQELTHATGAVVELLDGDELVYWSASGTVTSQLGMRVKSTKSLSGLCIETGRVLMCNDSESDPRVDLAACRLVGLRSMLVAPLPYGDMLIGVLKVVAPWPNAFHDQDVRTLELLNTLIGAALSHAAHHSSVEAAFNSKLEADRLVSEERDELRRRIRGVIDREAFELAFQPVRALDTGTIVGFEALARFNDGRPRPPDRWFDDAMRAELGFELEVAVARKAMRSLALLPSNTYLAVNVSPETAASAEIMRLCAGYSAGRIVLEITEHSSVDDYLALAERARLLRAMGVQLAIDDAGAGFSSLRHVLRLEPDLIKLDKSITRNIDKRARHQSLAAALLTFADGTSASIVAEGIETEAELATLKKLGVPYGQGYYLGRPEPLFARASR